MASLKVVVFLSFFMYSHTTESISTGYMSFLRSSLVDFRLYIVFVKCYDVDLKIKSSD